MRSVHKYIVIQRESQKQTKLKSNHLETLEYILYIDFIDIKDVHLNFAHRCGDELSSSETKC